MRILLVEDEASQAMATELMLKSEGLIVDSADLGEDSLELAVLREYDIIVLDLMLPDIDGYEVLHQLRSEQVRTPVLILSALNDADSKVRGLSLGADDYLTKPFDKAELIARIQAIARRSREPEESTIRIGRLHVILDTGFAEIEGRQLHLTKKEYEILKLLALRKGTTVTKEMFFNHLYRGRDEPDFKVIDVFVNHLRTKLAAASGGGHFIETLWGRGYVLRDPGDESDEGTVH